MYLHLVFFNSIVYALEWYFYKYPLHCNKNIYKFLSTILKKSIYVNSFIMGYGKRSLQDFYTLLHQNDSTTRILVSALFWLAEASIIFQNIEDELVYIYHVTFFCVLQIFHVFFVLEGSQSFGKIQLKPGNFIPF